MIGIFDDNANAPWIRYRKESENHGKSGIQALKRTWMMSLYPFVYVSVSLSLHLSLIANSVCKQASQTNRVLPGTKCRDACPDLQSTFLHHPIGRHPLHVYPEFNPLPFVIA